MKFYFMGICGTAMGNAALLLKKQGHEIAGSDSGIYPPMSTVLQDAGILMFDGFTEDNLKQAEPDYVIVGNAISRGNPEIEWLLETRAFPVVSLPQMLAERILKGRRNVVVSGTHGKTTTTTITATLLRAGGRDPGWLIGGVPIDLPGGAYLGDQSQPFAIEGDEYDSAFFDKRSKFIHYQPQVLILNNLEFDHGDIFRDLQDVKRTFSHLLRTIPRNGYVLANGDDANIRSLLPVPWTTVHTVGIGEDNDLCIRDFSEGPDGSNFRLDWKGEDWGRIFWKMTGEFNVRNAAMALLATVLALDLDQPNAEIIDALQGFMGIKRRQETLAEAGGLLVMEDFAHHPTALAGTLASFRNRFPDRRLVACFEPRSNTATTNIFQEDFTDALAHADEVLLGVVHRAEKITKDQRLDTEKMVEDLMDRDCLAHAFTVNADLLPHLQRHIDCSSSNPVLVCFFSNGGFDGVPSAFVDALKDAIPA
jgi:UDP-N-acetylmuramate: L-alanyl-gamma-D-glutamyl-meso-diaminopimelate ligase